MWTKYYFLLRLFPYKKLDPWINLSANRPSDVASLQKKRSKQTGCKRTEIDGKVKPAEDTTQQTTVLLAKLVTDVRRHARFDSSRTYRD